jgi:hypothetical protein
MSPLLLHAVGVFVPFMRELPEMAYPWACRLIGQGRGASLPPLPSGQQPVAAEGTTASVAIT